MVEFPLEPDAERELSALRARAYSPAADIEEDPAAMARLAELEGAHLTHAPFAHAAVAPAGSAGAHGADDPGGQPVPGEMGAEAVASPNDKSRPSHSPQSRAVWPTLVLAALAGVAAVLVVASAVAGIAGPHPDATLRPSGVEPDEMIAWRFPAEMMIDESTIRGYASYRGLEPWVAANADGGRCLIVAERSLANLQETSCTQPGVDPVVELGVWPGANTGFGAGLPQGSVIRFRLIGDAVHVFVYRGPES